MYMHIYATPLAKSYHQEANKNAQIISNHLKDLDISLQKMLPSAQPHHMAVKNNWVYPPFNSTFSKHHL